MQTIFEWAWREMHRLYSLWCSKHGVIARVSVQRGASLFVSCLCQLGQHVGSKWVRERSDEDGLSGHAFNEQT